PHANRLTRPTELRPAVARRREPPLPPPVPSRRCELPLHAPPRRREAGPLSRLGRQAAPPLLAIFDSSSMVSAATITRNQSFFTLHATHSGPHRFLSP